MTAKFRASVYAVAAAIGAVGLIYGWVTSEEAEAWLRVVDSFLNLAVIAAPLLALKNLTPDAPREVVADAPAVEPAGDEPDGA